MHVIVVICPVTGKIAKCEFVGVVVLLFAEYWYFTYQLIAN